MVTFCSKVIYYVMLINMLGDASKWCIVSIGSDMAFFQNCKGLDPSFDYSTTNISNLQHHIV